MSRTTLLTNPRSPARSSTSRGDRGRSDPGL